MSAREPVWLISKATTALSIELNSLVPRSAPRMRRGSPFQLVPINLQPMQKVDLTQVLNCSADEARGIAAKTPMLNKLLKQALIEVR